MNKRRARIKCANLCNKKPIKLETLCRPWSKFQNLINVGPLIRLLGLEKNPKLINVGPTFIPDYRVWDYCRLGVNKYFGPIAFYIGWVLRRLLVSKRKQPVY